MNYSRIGGDHDPITMAKPRQESIKSRDGPRLLRVVELYAKEGRAAAREQ